MTTASPASKKIVVTRVGIVESDARDKTRKVVVPNPTIHPKYGKIIRRRTVLHVHDEANESRNGDMVEVTPCRPMSKTKRWKLSKIVQKAAALKFEGAQTPEEREKAEAAAKAAAAAKAPAKAAAKKPAAKK
jgi:small subunit ribosomal protein S17